MSYTYTTFVQALATQMVTPADEPDLVSILPTIIRSAELRMYRDLDLLHATQMAYRNLSAGQRMFSLPTTGDVFTIVDQVNLIGLATLLTEDGDTLVTEDDYELALESDDAGDRIPLVQASFDALTMMHPSATDAAVPIYYAMHDDVTVVVGPWPLADYTAEVRGRLHPATLSASNPETFISVNLPDVFLAAAMVESAAYQKNFSASSDGPQSGVSWEQHYKALAVSANLEEARRKLTPLKLTPGTQQGAA